MAMMKKMMMTNIYQKQVKGITKVSTSFYNQIQGIGLNQSCPDCQKAPIYTITGNLGQLNFLLSNQIALKQYSDALNSCISGGNMATNLINLTGNLGMTQGCATSAPIQQACGGNLRENAVSLAKTLKFKFGVLQSNMQNLVDMQMSSSASIKLKARFGNYAPTDMKTVGLMLDAAKLKKGEVLADLGCGDGRIIVEAAKRGAKKAIGVDVDQRRIKNSSRNIIKSNVGDKVELQQCDIMDMKGLEHVDVVSMYLWSDGMETIKPMLLSKLKKGARVVSHQFKFKTWKPASVHDIPGRKHKVYVYVV